MIWRNPEEQRWFTLPPCCDAACAGLLLDAEVLTGRCKQLSRVRKVSPNATDSQSAVILCKRSSCHGWVDSGESRGNGGDTQPIWIHGSGLERTPVTDSLDPADNRVCFVEIGSVCDITKIGLKWSNSCNFHYCRLRTPRTPWKDNATFTPSCQRDIMGVQLSMCSYRKKQICFNGTSFL